jgi:hypothetical protein
LLVGNGSGRPSKFATTKVVAIRWHDLAVTAPVKDLPVMPAPSSGIRPLFDLIAKHESGGNYNARFGKATNHNPMFTEMTVGQVLDWQRQRGAGGFTAVGRYQIIKKTMQGLIESMKLTGSERFGEAMQDKMALQLLNGRKLGSFLAGKLGVVGFGLAIAQEWASLPVLERTRGAHRMVDAGETYYAGDRVNKAGATVNEVRRVLEALAAGHILP